MTHLQGDIKLGSIVLSSFIQNWYLCVLQHAAKPWVTSSSSGWFSFVKKTYQPKDTERGSLFANPRLAVTTKCRPLVHTSLNKSKRRLKNIPDPAKLDLAAYWDLGFVGCLKPVQGRVEAVFHRSPKATSTLWPPHPCPTLSFQQHCL